MFKHAEHHQHISRLLKKPSKSVTVNLSSFVILIVLSLVTFASMLEVAYAELTETYGSLTNESKLTMSVSPSETSAGRTTHIAIIIDNNEKYDVKLTKMELVSPWQIVKTLDSPLVIKSNSSSILTFDVPIQHTVEPDTYTLVISVTDSNEIAKTSSVTLRIKEFAPLKLEYSWILALLSAYYIPAQIIERILEVLRLTRPTEEKTSIKTLLAEGSPKTITKTTKIYKKFDDLYKTISDLEDQLAFKKRIKAKIEEVIEGNVLKDKKLPDENDGKYQLKLIIDSQISEISTDLSKAKKHQSFLVWTVGLAMSVVPGSVFACYGLGLLQTVGQSSEISKVVDIVFNSLIIASGTKPIHDIIKRIKGD